MEEKKGWQCDYRGRGWSDVAISQGTLTFIKSYKRQQSFPLSSRVGTAWQHFDFESLAPKTVRKYVFVVLSHPVLGNLLQQPQEHNFPPKFFTWTHCFSFFHLSLVILPFHGCVFSLREWLTNLHQYLNLPWVPDPYFQSQWYSPRNSRVLFS